jgi:hypothetical protein
VALVKEVEDRATLAEREARERVSRMEERVPQGSPMLVPGSRYDQGELLWWRGSARNGSKREC